MRIKHTAIYQMNNDNDLEPTLRNTTAEGERIDYAYRSQIGERRIQNFIDWQWEEFAKHGRTTAGNYIFEMTFEF